MLEVNNLCSGYSGNDVVKNLSFTALSGQITAVIGPNGCGKSTLIKSLCGIIKPHCGQIILNGENLSQLTQKAMAQKISYLAQSRQSPDITVGRLILHGRFPYLDYPRRYRPEDYEAAERAMAKMQLTDLAEIPMNRLSGGQQQKAYIAMALAQDTEVLLLDEPTTYLDVSHQLQVLKEAKALSDLGKHIIMVIHDLSYAMEIADKIILMNEGTAKMQGTPEEIYLSGAMDNVFSVKVLRMQHEGKWKYFCSDK